MAETELDRFFRENRLREAQSVNPSVFQDPRYASMIYNSSVPLNQLEKNIQQSQGYMLEPAYSPTMRDTSQNYVQSALEYLKSKGIVGKDVREGKTTLKDVKESFTGTEDSIGLVDATPIGSIFAAQEGQRALEKAEPDAFKRQMAVLGTLKNPLQSYLDRPEIAGPVFEIGASAVEGLGFAYLARPAAKKLKNFAKSLSDKIMGEGEVVATKIGALPKAEPKMLASTRRMPPGGGNVMTDPKVVDEFGFYSEAERQAKMMQQNKGTGAQFQGMLLNKGVKLDEIKALGLDELFKNEKVTKKEIVDTIDLNKFQLIEKKRIGKGSPIGYEMEFFTDIRGADGKSFTSADEIKNAMDIGEYERPIIRYEDGTFNGFETAYEGEQLTHTPTQHKIVRVQTTDSNRDEIFFTFKPNANTNDWRNSNEAKQYVDEINETGGDFGLQLPGAKTANLTTEDFDTIVREYAPYSFDEATVRIKSAAEDGGNVPFAKFESNTQEGGENYKEFVLSLPPFDKTKGYQDKVDINFPRHFPEFNPVFHIRTKDRVTPDGKKVLYVEELQSDFGQQGRDRGFKLKGEDLEKAKAKLKVAEDDLMELKDIEVNLTSTEVKDLFQLKNPGVIFVDVNDPKLIDYTTAAGKDPRFKIEVIDPYRPPEEYRYGTIEEVAKLRQYQNYKALHKIGDISDEFFEQLDLSQMGRTQDEIKSEIIKMFSSGRLDRGSLITTRDGTGGLSRVFDENLQKGDEIIKKYYKAQVQTQGEDAPIPDAPFVKDTEKWTGLAIKRLLQMAEKGGYDHIAFSPGDVQFNRWGDEGLIKYYDDIIPSVARDTTKKMKDKSANMNTTGYVDIEFPNDKADKSVGMSMTADGRYFTHEIGSDRPIEGKYFSNKEEANAFADKIEDSRQEKINQKTFAINITPKVKETVRGGMPLFSATGGALGLGATMSDEDYGALSNMPSTQANAT